MKKNIGLSLILFALIATALWAAASRATVDIAPGWTCPSPEPGKTHEIQGECTPAEDDGGDDGSSYGVPGFSQD